jgi:hypothetical protein
MIECIGWRTPRWVQMKRREFLLHLQQPHLVSTNISRCILGQESRLNHTISGLSSNSGSSTQFSSEDDSNTLGKHDKRHSNLHGDVKDMSDSSRDIEQGNCDNGENRSGGHTSMDYRDYNELPVPKPQFADCETTDEPDESNSSISNGKSKQVSLDSSSGDDSAVGIAPNRRKSEIVASNVNQSQIKYNTIDELAMISEATGESRSIPNIPNGSSRLVTAPAVVLPPFAGIGKRSTASSAALISRKQARESSGSVSTRGSSSSGAAVIANVDVVSSSSSSSGKTSRIRGSYHINEDDMILMEDVIMCPFIFRTEDAVLCGALSECVMPGMIRVCFSSRNKLKSLEFVYDSMGFMQQLERASGNEGSAQIIPGSIEMALSPSNSEARVITLASPPYLIVNVNEVWTRTTGYTQMEVEGKEYLSLLEGEATIASAYQRPGEPPHMLEEVAKGRCACSTNIHYDKDNCDFIEFVCSFPLTKYVPYVSIFA